jgi:hypothetical protein
MPIFKYDILGLTPGRPKSRGEYSGVVRADTPKAALLAALDDNFGDKDDGDTPYERLTAGWSDTVEIDDCWGELDDDADSFVLPSDDHEFHVSVELADEEIAKQAEAQAPDDIDDVRPSDRFVP